MSDCFLLLMRILFVWLNTSLQSIASYYISNVDNFEALVFHPHTERQTRKLTLGTKLMENLLNSTKLMQNLLNG